MSAEEKLEADEWASWLAELDRERMARYVLDEITTPAVSGDDHLNLVAVAESPEPPLGRAGGVEENGGGFGSSPQAGPPTANQRNTT